MLGHISIDEDLPRLPLQKQSKEMRCMYVVNKYVQSGAFPTIAFFLIV